MSRTPGTKGERKTSKLFEKVGLKQLDDITRVTIKRPKNVLISIANPQVFATTDNGIYIVIGEPKFEDMTRTNKQQLAQLQAQLAQMQAANEPKVQEVKEDENEEPLDAGDLDNKDIELVMSQANVSRNKAIKALQENENDVVNAIMELTM